MEKTTPPKLFSPKRQFAVETRAKNINKEDAFFLVELAAEAICDRLDATNRDFAECLDLHSAHTIMVRQLAAASKVTNIKHLPSNAGADLEDLNLSENSENLITSIFGLHRCNDVLGQLIQIHRALVSDGLFMACLPGDRTLHELRSCLIEAESTLYGAANLRVDPFIEVRQAGGLLQRAGFALPVVDADVFTVRYDSVFHLIKDLRSMGATSVLDKHAGFAPYELFSLTDEIYKQKFSDEDGRIRASVEIVYLSGWKPHKSQQQPLKPGSALKSLKDVL